MPELSRNPDDYEDHDAYAHAQALNAQNDTRAEFWAIGGSEPEAANYTEYGVEPELGWNAEGITDDLATAIENSVAYRHGARIITRTVTWGPWRYVTPDEIEAEV